MLVNPITTEGKICFHGGKVTVHRPRVRSMVALTLHNIIYGDAGLAYFHNRGRSQMLPAA
jgi:hypothetical protein